LAGRDTESLAWRETALTRQTSEGNPPGGFIPQQRLSLEDTIRGYTLGRLSPDAAKKTKARSNQQARRLHPASTATCSKSNLEIDKTEVLITVVAQSRLSITELEDFRTRG